VGLSSWRVCATQSLKPKEQQVMSEATSMLTTADVAIRLKVSDDTALRIMQTTPGVLRLGSEEKGLYRMPESVFKAFVERKSNGKGGRR